MSQADAEVIVASFQKENHLSNSDLAAIKNSDIDTLVPLFCKDANEKEQELIALSLRNIMRFVTPHFRFGEASVTTQYNARYIALQKTAGEFNGVLGFLSNNDSLIHIANAYAKEEFTSVDEDVFDAVCEFINCINGLFATKLCSDGIEIDMLPPEDYVEIGRAHV